MSLFSHLYEKRKAEWVKPANSANPANPKIGRVAENEKTENAQPANSANPANFSDDERKISNFSKISSVGKSSKTHFSNTAVNGDEEKSATANPANPAKSPIVEADRAAKAVKWARAEGYHLALTDDGDLQLTGADPTEIQPAYLRRLGEIKGEIIDFLSAEKTKEAAERKRFVNSDDWVWPKDLSYALRAANQKNVAAEARGQSDRFCICGLLAHSSWPTNKGNVWLCDDCRETGVSGLTVQYRQSRLVRSEIEL